MNVRAGVLLISLPMAWACASSGASQAGAARRGHDPNVITAEELQSASGSNLFELVRALRPEWLTPRGTARFNAQGGVAVYMDRVRMGGVDVLRQVAPSSVVSLRFLGPSEAGAEFGLDVMEGAIQIITRRQQ